MINNMFILKILMYIFLSIFTIYYIYSLIFIICYKKKIKKDKLKVVYQILNSKVNNKISNKVKKNRFYIKLGYYVCELKKINEKKYKFLSNFFVILISIIFSIVIFVISKYIFEIFSTSILISIISLVLPYFIIEQLYISEKNKILEKFPLYILTLKNYVYSTNNIVQAFKKAKIPDYLNVYISKFNISIEKGISISQAFEELKRDINIDVINDFLSSLLTCHLNGGNVCVLLNKYAEMLTKTNLQNAKSKQENISSILIFIIMACINIFLLFSFVYSNVEYKEIMTSSFIGKTIINFNILSYLVVFLLYRNVMKRV